MHEQMGNAAKWASGKTRAYIKRRYNKWWRRTARRKLKQWTGGPMEREQWADIPKKHYYEGYW